MAYQTGVPETRNACPQPPYNATNFNADSPVIFSTLQSYAGSQPQYPLPVGSDANQVYRNTANVTYFNAINQQTAAIRSTNQGLAHHMPYPQFKSEGERLMYRQGLATTAARTAMAGRNPAGPMGVPLSTNYQIINS